MCVSFVSMLMSVVLVGFIEPSTSAPVAQSECSVLKRKWNAEKYAMQRHDCCAATSAEGKANKNIFIAQLGHRSCF